MAIRLVVFDVAGTTVQDSGRAVERAMHDAIAATGLVLRDGAMDGVTGLAKPQAIRMLLEGHGRDELLPRLDEIHADFRRRMERHFANSPDVTPVPGAVETFAALRRRGIRVALGTGFSRAILATILNRLGWSGPSSPVDDTITSDEVRRGRPYPDMIDALRARGGAIPSAEVAKVGDTPVDLQEGTMARCGLVVGVLTGIHQRESLAQHHNDAIIESVAGLEQLLVERGVVGS